MLWRMHKLAAVIGFVALTFALSGCSTAERQSSQSSPAESQERAACFEAMHAASVVSGLNNDAELLATAEQCSGVETWVEALQANPGAGSLTSYTEADALDLLTLVCSQTSSAPVCADAVAKGKL